MDSYQKETVLKCVGDRIAGARRKRGLSQDGLLDVIYRDMDLLLDRNTLSLIERGRIATSGYNLYVICSALGLSLDELFF